MNVIITIENTQINKIGIIVLFRISNVITTIPSFSCIYNNLPLCSKGGEAFLLDPFLLRV